MINNWERFLPGFIRKQFEKYENLKKITENIGWLFINRILGLVIGVFTGVWLARYLGPEKLGIWNYAIAFTGLFGALASLGLDSIVIRDIVNKPEDKDIILGSAFILKLFSGILTFFICIIAISLIKKNNTLILYLVGLNAIIYIFHSLNVIDFYFQSQVMSKYVVYAQNLAMVIGTISTIILLILKAPLVMFAIISVANALLSAFFMIIAYHYKKHSIFMWNFKFAEAKRLLKESLPLMIAFFSYLVYIKTDQIMLEHLIDSEAVGIYSVAVSLSDMPFLIVLLITQTISPIMIKLYKYDKKEYYKKYLTITFVSTLLSYFFVVLAYFIKNDLINLLYGKRFFLSSNILFILILGKIFMFNALLRSTHLVVSNNQKIFMTTTLLAAITNILFNLILIPEIGISGAAISTVIAQFLSLVLFNSFFKSTRNIFLIQCKALLVFPFIIRIKRGGNVPII